MRANQMAEKTRKDFEKCVLRVAHSRSLRRMHAIKLRKLNARTVTRIIHALQKYFFALAPTYTLERYLCPSLVTPTCILLHVICALHLPVPTTRTCTIAHMRSPARALLRVSARRYLYSRVCALLRMRPPARVCETLCVCARRLVYAGHCSAAQTVPWARPQSPPPCREHRCSVRATRF